MKHFVGSTQNSTGNPMVSATPRPIRESSPMTAYEDSSNGAMRPGTHMSLNEGETPSQAFIRKMLESDVVDSQTGQRYRIDKINHSGKD